MKRPPYLCVLHIIITLLCLLFITTACTVLGGAPGEPSPTPVPTSSIPGMQVIAPQACRVAEHVMIRVEGLQGDLIAWSPVENTVAYIASTQGSTWNVGELNLLSAPKFDDPVRLAQQVAGELAWSPDGLMLAYLGLRRSDNLYTIGLAYPDGRSPLDLFPGESARTDSYASQKAISDWLNEARLRVYTSCGLDCMQGISIGVLTGLTSETGDPIQREWELWSTQTHQPVRIASEYKDLPGELNWSPDESQIAYTDENGSVWIINVETGDLYPLDIGEFGTATETDWSYDSQYLAVHVDRNLMIFSLDCQ